MAPKYTSMEDQILFHLFFSANITLGESDCRIRELRITGILNSDTPFSSDDDGNREPEETFLIVPLGLDRNSGSDSVFG